MTIQKGLDKRKSGHSNNRCKCCCLILGLRALALFFRMNCTSYIHPQDSDSSGTSSVSELGAEQESGRKDFEHGGLHQSLRLLMWAQILRAGPSLMFMVDMRCSSFSSRRACPSISCDRNWEASSSQPAEEDKWK